MKTPAQRHYLTTVAALASANADPNGSLAGSSKYELMLAKLDIDRRRLKEIQSVERKIDVKREVLPEYKEWVDGALSGGNGAQDLVLVTIMVWMIDVGDYQSAMPVIEYVLKHNLLMPDQYERTVPTVIVDEISDAALKAQKVKKVFDIEVLEHVRQLTDGFDMPDQARAKLYKAIGTELYTSEQYEDALERFQRALELDDRSGVKLHIKDIKKILADNA